MYSFDRPKEVVFRHPLVGWEFSKDGNAGKHAKKIPLNLVSPTHLTLSDVSYYVNIRLSPAQKGGKVHAGSVNRARAARPSGHRLPNRSFDALLHKLATPEIFCADLIKL